MNQIQLSDTQAVILSAACARDDGLVFPVTAKIKGGAVGNCLKSLLKRGLIEELPANDPGHRCVRRQSRTAEGSAQGK